MSIHDTQRIFRCAICGAIKTADEANADGWQAFHSESGDVLFVMCGRERHEAGYRERVMRMAHERCNPEVEVLTYIDLGLD